MTKRIVATLVLTLAAAVTMAAQKQSTTAPKKQDPAKDVDVTLTGCLIQGSGPTVFLLDHAKANAMDTNDKGKRYLVFNTMEDANLASHLNHEMAMTGTWSMKMSGNMSQVDEKNLPILTVKSVMMVADRCSTGWQL